MKYTEEDVRREAARQYATLLGGHMDFLSVSESMVDAPLCRGGDAWGLALDKDEYEEAQRAVWQRLRNATDLSEWAVNMGADGLVPAATEVTLREGDGQAVVRVHFAFDPDLSEESANQVIASVAQHLSNIV